MHQRAEGDPMDEWRTGASGSSRREAGDADGDATGGEGVEGEAQIDPLDPLQREDILYLMKQLQALSLRKRRTGAPVLSSFDAEGVAKYIKENNVKNIVCMCGAGISVSAGIPDFRTPGTGIYSKVEKYKLRRPEEIFSLSYFRENPEPFVNLAKEMIPGKYRPTPAHYFITLLQKKGLLLRCFTQNIDCLERLAGLPTEYIVAAHGNFDGAHCIGCHKAYDIDQMKGDLEKGNVSKCSSCGAYAKPDIVFFGEALPPRFFMLAGSDMPKCSLLIILGTSLVVHPFASLVDEVGSEVPRLLINNEIVGESVGLDFGAENYRDAKILGSCDDGVFQLAELLGWKEELDALIEEGAKEAAATSSAKEDMATAAGSDNGANSSS
ncbi:unnamed protein product [Ostreobium quekettii]|uniref:Deacetylase sirtuin-type domain-containing protein n=1 Tax=Ostreobium quekettii TaxID=121088 RepID=A0A8S1IU00_9CHLO|nr:unnamed protein product [Ostreobium quekettii]|eukprot:evm.model.scf_186.9 EVM.evm.TU.scf_186.9   scf_186:76689-82438(+)